jgi:hypothetical protein
LSPSRPGLRSVMTWIRSRLEVLVKVARVRRVRPRLSIWSMRTVGSTVGMVSPYCAGRGTIGGRNKKPVVPPLWSSSEIIDCAARRVDGSPVALSELQPAASSSGAQSTARVMGLSLCLNIIGSPSWLSSGNPSEAPRTQPGGRWQKAPRAPMAR